MTRTIYTVSDKTAKFLKQTSWCSFFMTEDECNSPTLLFICSKSLCKCTYASSGENFISVMSLSHLLRMRQGFIHSAQACCNTVTVCGQTPWREKSSIYCYMLILNSLNSEYHSWNRKCIFEMLTFNGTLVIQ